MLQDLWRGLAMQLEVLRESLTPSPCGERFTRKDSHMHLIGRNLVSFPLSCLWEE